MEVLIAIVFIFILFVALIVGFAVYADAHHFPTTWEQVAARKRQKPYLRERYVTYVADDFGSDSDYDYKTDASDFSDDGELYGGIPFGDGKIYMTDDDDFIDEFGDDVF